MRLPGTGETADASDIKLGGATLPLASATAASEGPSCSSGRLAQRPKLLDVADSVGPLGVFKQKELSHGVVSAWPELTRAVTLDGAQRGSFSLGRKSTLDNWAS